MDADIYIQMSSVGGDESGPKSFLVLCKMPSLLHNNRPEYHHEFSRQSFTYVSYGLLIFANIWFSEADVIGY